MAKSFGMKDPMATGHAAGVTAAIIYVACRLLVGAFPNFMFTVGQSWFHGIQLTRMSAWSLTGSAFVLGLISSFAFAWLVGYIFAILYNRFLK